MTDYKQLIEALRDCADTCNIIDECDIEACTYQDELPRCVDKMMQDAAAAIEALQAEMPKRGKWIRVQEVDIPGEMHPVAFKCMCSICRNEYLFPRIPRYCPDCGSMNTAKMEVQE